MNYLCSIVIFPLYMRIIVGSVFGNNGKRISHKIITESPGPIRRSNHPFEPFITTTYCCLRIMNHNTAGSLVFLCMFNIGFGTIGQCCEGTHRNK